MADTKPPVMRLGVRQRLRSMFLGARREFLTDEKHHESNLAWGPIAIGCSIVLTVIAARKHDLRFLFVAAWPCLVFGAWRLCKRIPYKALSYWIVGLSSIVVAASLWGLNLWLAPPSNGGQPAESLPDVPVYLGCQMYGTSITILPHSTAFIMPLNPKFEPPAIPLYAGFDEVMNIDETNLIWPSDTESSPALIPSPPGHPGSRMQKCTVMNTSDFEIEALNIVFGIKMDRNSSPGTPEHDFNYGIAVRPLHAHDHFDFYMADECPAMFAYVFNPKTVRVAVIGEKTSREVPLLQSKQDVLSAWPSEMFMPGYRIFANKPPCE